MCSPEVQQLRTIFEYSMMQVPGKIRRGRPKRRWLDSIRNDLSEKGLSGEDAQDRPRWRRLTRHIDPTRKWGKMKKKKNG